MVVREGISFLTTGGTIDKVYFDRSSEFSTGESQIDKYLRSFNSSLNYNCKKIISKDSLDMTDEDRNLIVEAIKVDENCRIVITHGTDSMVKTMKCIVDAEIDKIIVLTGSFKPLEFRDTDAIFNVAMAIGVAKMAKSPCTLICMNGVLFDNPEKTCKSRENQRFELRV